MCGYQIVQRILDSLRMATVTCYLVFGFCVAFIRHFQQRNPVVLRHSDIGHVIEKQRGYAGEISNGRYTSYKPDKTRRLLFLGGFRT
jgi:hypothetical protein